MLSAFRSPFALHFAFPPAVVAALPLRRRGSVSLPFLDGADMGDTIAELSAGGGGGGGGAGTRGARGAILSSIEDDGPARGMFGDAGATTIGSGSSSCTGFTTNSLLAFDEGEGGVRSMRGASISSSSDSGSSSFAFFCSARICFRHIMA